MRDDIAAMLIAIARADQDYRQGWFEHHGEAAYEEGQSELDRENTTRLKTIVDEIGWPDRMTVGAEASHAAWLLVQHASNDQTFQSHCLELMKALPAGQLDQRQIAYLTDRIQILADKTQVFGTQYMSSSEPLLPLFPLQDAKHVDELRQQYDLSPLVTHYDVAKMAAAAETGETVSFSDINGYLL